MSDKKMEQALSAIWQGLFRIGPADDKPDRFDDENSPEIF